MVWPNRKDIHLDFGLKKLKLKRGDVRVKTRGSLTALVWKDRWEMYMLTNINPPPGEGNLCDDNSRSVKPHIVEQYKLPCGVRRQFWLCGQQLFDESMYLQVYHKNCFSTFWIWQYSTIGFCYLHVEGNICTEISDSFWWGIWSKQVEEAKVAPPPAWLEGRVQLQQMLWGWKAAPTNTGQPRPANSTAT